MRWLWGESLPRCSRRAVDVPMCPPLFLEAWLGIPPITVMLARGVPSPFALSAAKGLILRAIQRQTLRFAQGERVMR